MLQENRLTEIEHELSQLPSNVKWLCPGAKIKYVAVDDSSDESLDISPQGGPMQNQSTMKIELPEQPAIEINNEWTIVTRARRKK